MASVDHSPSGADGTSLPPMMVMDPEGDVILVIPRSNGKKARFQINSNILCVASPVFRAMLGKHSRFKEGRALAAARLQSDTDTASGFSRAYELTLAGDNANAFAVVLRILHTKNNLVPSSLNEYQLYGIAVICDKYDLTPAVMLWVDRWMPQLVPNESRNPPIVTGHKWLFITYVFGRKKLFHKLTQEIILNSTIDDSGALVIGGARINEYIPDSILRKLSNIAWILSMSGPSLTCYFRQH